MINRKTDTATRRKLKEAEFFFKKLEESYRIIPDFDHYLSAFISSARSVTWVMKKEYNNVPGWKEWNESNDWPEKQKLLIDSMNEVRIRTQKKEALSTLHEVKLEGMELEPDEAEGFLDLMDQIKGKSIPVRLTLEADGFLWQTEIDGVSHKYSGTIATATRQLAEFPGEDILQVCSDYLQAVTDVVNECGRRFSTSEAV